MYDPREGSKIPTVVRDMRVGGRDTNQDKEITRPG